MRRFHSHLIPLQRAQHQLLTVAELRLAQAQASVRRMDDAIMQLQDLQLQAGNNFRLKLLGRQFQDARQVQAVQDRLARLSNDIQMAHEQRRQQQAEVEHRKNLYRQLKTRSDGVDRLVEKQRSQHRRQQLKHEQTQLDEAAQLRIADTFANSPAEGIV